MNAVILWDIAPDSPYVNWRSWNVDSHTDYMALYPRICQNSELPLWEPEILHVFR
jgi:hypothetical protein